MTMPQILHTDVAIMGRAQSRAQDTAVPGFSDSGGRSALKLLFIIFGLATSPICIAVESMPADELASDSGLLVEPVAVPGLHGLLGVQAAARQRTIGNDRVANILPLFALNYRNILYWNGLTGGVWLTPAIESSPRLGLGLRLRRGWAATDDPLLAGMADRDNSVEGGVNILWPIKSWRVGFGYFTDLSDNSEGQSASLRLSRRFVLSPDWQIVPGLSLEWLSKDVVDYYYGITGAEATPSRPVYAGRAGLNIRAGLVATYSLTPRWMLLVGVNHTRLGSAIADSPVVLRNSLTELHAGIGLRF